MGHGHFENADGGSGDKPKRPGATSGKWEEPAKIDAKYKEAGKRVTAPPDSTIFTAEPEVEAKKVHSIDPGPFNPTGKKLEEKFPNLKEVVLELQKIGNEEFWHKNPEALKSDNLPDFLDLAKKMPEALLYRAVTENWKTETLYDEYRNQMQNLYTRSASRPLVHEALGQIQRAWDWVAQTENKGEDGINEFIEGKRQIKLGDKPAIITELNAMERAYFDGKDICVEWTNGKGCNDWEGKDDYDEDRLEFIKNNLLPFYKSWILNKGIVENRSRGQIYDAYGAVLANLAASAEK